MPAALGQRPAARVAARRAAGKKARPRRKPPAAQALREVRADGRVRAGPGHPWLDPAITGDPGHVPARPAVAVDGKERKLAKAGGKGEVHLLAAVTHVTGLVIGQDKVAGSGKANEVTHFRPLPEPLPLAGVLVTSDALCGRPGTPEKQVALRRPVSRSAGSGQRAGMRSRTSRSRGGFAAHPPGR